MRLIRESHMLNLSNFFLTQLSVLLKPFQEKMKLKYHLLFFNDFCAGSLRRRFLFWSFLLRRNIAQIICVV